MNKFFCGAALRVTIEGDVWTILLQGGESEVVVTIPREILGDYITVPREPTYDMLRAARSRDCEVECKRDSCCHLAPPDEDESRAIWKAMVGAAPK